MLKAGHTMDTRTKAVLEEVGCRSEEGRRHAVREIRGEIARSFQRSTRDQRSHDYWVQLWSELNEKVLRLRAACTACTLHAHLHLLCAACRSLLWSTRAQCTSNWAGYSSCRSSSRSSARTVRASAPAS